MQTSPQGTKTRLAPADAIRALLNAYPKYDPLRAIARDAARQQALRAPRIRMRDTFSKDPKLCRHACNRETVSPEKNGDPTLVRCGSCKTVVASLGVVE